MYTNASNNNPSYTYVSSYVVRRVHPLGKEETSFSSPKIIYSTKTVEYALISLKYMINEYVFMNLGVLNTERSHHRHYLVPSLVGK